MSWQQNTENGWFRSDYTYAGKDHTKNVKTFICISNLDEEKAGFKTIEDAMKYADSEWPEEI